MRPSTFTAPQILPNRSSSIAPAWVCNTILAPIGIANEYTGQGKIGYTVGDESGPRNGERTGWAINEQNHLQFDGSDLIACPNSIDGAYSIWASAGVANPAGNQDCVGIAARVEKDTTPVSCTYSS
jgi:hypothetical protein